MLKNSEIRAFAYSKLKGNWQNPVLATLVCIAVISVTSCLPPAVILLLPLEFGLIMSFLKLVRNDEPVRVEDQFSVFSNYGRVLGVTLLNMVYIILWSMLFLIPGIIKAYSYAMSYYIANDEPDFTADECIEASMKMMEGHKMRLFLLDLSFFGWALLATLTFGIGYLWLIPYMYTARAKFYEELKASYVTKG